MITIIDYGVGNLFSLSSSLNYLGLENKVSRDPEDLKKADHIILPGVGAYGRCDCEAAGIRHGGTALRRSQGGQADHGIRLECASFDKSYEYGKHRGSWD